MGLFTGGFVFIVLYMSHKKEKIHNPKHLEWSIPKVFILNIGSTNGKFDTWPDEGGPGAGDRCTNPNNPNYNPNGRP